jgi:PKD domain/Secretion system C-terminal sorting domain
MRKFQPQLFACALVFACSFVHAQDTTALRFAAFSDGGEFILFKNDTSNLYYGPLNIGASYNALFHHPVSGQLICLFDSVQGIGDRNFYEIDPFSNSMTQVFNSQAPFLAAACVGPNGLVYAVTGNGGSGPGDIYQIDLSNGTENLFASTDMSFGGSAQVGMNISYYPPTNELWLFGGSVDSLVKINLNTQVETRVGAYLNADGGLKATYLDGTTFWLCSDVSYLFDGVAADSVRPSTFTTPDYFTDIELLDLIEGSDTLAICSGDSIQLRSRFRFDDYHWYFNGNPLPTHLRAFNTATPGTYQLLAQFNPGSLVIWSETIEVVAQVSPTAGFGYSPAAVVTGTPVTFTDSSLNAGIYAWDFGDGSFSPQSNPSHTYTTPGTYIVSQIVQNGLCTDTAFVTIVVTLGVSTDPSLVGAPWLTLAPNPSQGPVMVAATVSATSQSSLVVFNDQGRAVLQLHKGPLDAGTHRFELNAASELAPGIYLIQFQTDQTRSTQRMLIQR